ncbi:MAG: hypothetical protein KC931_23420, partial [Candidatus Omnitrophica bacterium]|nr:hypothetical protein [Candidatus Omnitrophota bacterium]
MPDKVLGTMCQLRKLNLAVWVVFLLMFAVSRGESSDGDPHRLTVLDLRKSLDTEFSGTDAYDAAKAVGALQGIVNRDGPRLYVLYLPNRMAIERGFPVEEPCQDLYWLKWLREEGRFLADHEIRESTDVWKVFEWFKKDLEGIVVWDNEVPSTSNVASTIAGAEVLLPIRGNETAGSFYSQWVDRFPDLPVQVDLRNRFTGVGRIPETEMESTGSAKC